jgi:signal transduction histidine kinase
MLNSLKFKIIIPGFIVISLIMVSSTIRDIILTKEQLLETQKEKTGLLSDRIAHGIMVLMMSNRWQELQGMMESFARGSKDLREIRIFVPETGIIKVSSDLDDIGKRIYDEDYNKYLMGVDEPFLIKKEGKLYASKITMIKNHRACHRCHGSEKDVLGVMDIELSLDAMFASIEEFKSRHIRNGIIGFILVILTFAIIVTFLIDRPIHRMISTIKRIEGGDLSARMQIKKKDELGQLAKSFNSMVESLEKTKKELEEYHKQQLDRAARLASIGEVASGIAHEIRNPLTSISCAIQVLQSEMKDDTRGKKVIQEIQNQIKRLDSTIKDLLNYARPATPMLKLSDIAEVVEKAGFFVSAEAKKHNVNMEIDKGDDIPAVMIDPNQMQQVFMNIMLNAIQAMPSGGSLKVSIKTERPEELKDEIRGKIKSEVVLVVSFKDTGEGILPEDMKNIFEPFFTKKSKGSGLGLSISRRIVMEHGGEITCISNPDKGTTFYVYLPVNTEGLL